MLQFFKNLFQKQEKGNSPVLHELIARTDAEKHSYEVWKVNNHKDYLIGFLNKQFEAQWNNQPQESDAVFIIHNEKTRGFIFTYEEVKATTAEFKHLFDYLKERVRVLNYKVYVSDVKHYARQNHVETIERHYLKPRLSLPDKGTKANQQYGNITIEQLLHNDKPVQIKFVSHPYSDHNYTVSLPFKELMEAVLQ